MIIFNPNGEVTREEFVKMLIGAVGKLNADAQCSFTDVPENEWYYQYIASAYNDGIVTGRDDGSFGIGDKISRQDMAVMLMRAAEVYEIDVQSINTAIDFSDKDNIADYAVEAVSAAQQAGIMTGTDDDRFDPILTATRAMAATVIYRLTK